MPKILNDDRDPMKLALGEKLRKMKKEQPQELANFLQTLNEREASEILYDQEIWARKEQWIDLSDGFPITMLLAGRGMGKGFSGASTIKRAVERFNITSMLIIAPTARDFRANLAPSLIEMYPPDHPNRPYWSPSKASIIWPNGAVAICVPAEAGEDSVRGLNTELIFCDELASYDEGIVTQALLTLRKEPSKMIVTTTPKAHPMIIDLVDRASDPLNRYVKLITGKTYDNIDNLSTAFVDTVIKKYEGTRLGEQELEGKLILTNDAALWQFETITRNTITYDDVPELIKIAIGVDPAMMAKSSSRKGRTPDRTGISVVGLGVDSKLYALEGQTGSYSAEGWVEKVATLYDKYAQQYDTKIVAEINIIGKEMLMMAMEKGGKGYLTHKIRPVFATQSKLQRASPFALLSEQNKVKFVEGEYLKLLSMECTTFTGQSGEKSPDALDSFIWACSELKPAKKRVTRSYELLM